MNIPQGDIARTVPPFLKRDISAVSANENVEKDRRSFSQASRDRAEALRQRDIERGYSINVKQVVLAFAVEFWIIALIVVGTYLLIAESDNISREAVFSALLLPAALAMVELARVPLAIAVRTQDRWHIKLFAAVGVIAAITITSFSLSQIAWKTFDVRIAEAIRANDKLAEARTSKNNFLRLQTIAQKDLDQKIQGLEEANKRLASLREQLQKLSHTGQSCKPLLDEERKPLIGPDGKAQTVCTTVAAINNTQTNLLKNELANATKDADNLKVAAANAEGELKKFDVRPIEAEIAKADALYRAAINKSQLHSYTAMVTGKAVSEVTEADVKSLEKYLIIIPSIAAAFASTLIAITAVRRIKPRPTDAPVELPDEAVTHLFGPLVVAIQKQVDEAVTEAIAKKREPTVESKISS